MTSLHENTAKQDARPRRGLSLAAKISTIVAVSIVCVSASILLITFKYYSDKVDEIFQERVESASKVSAYLTEPKGLALIWEYLQTDEFERVRQQAVESNDEKVIVEWMKGVEVEYVDLFGVEPDEGDDPGWYYYETLYDVYEDYAEMAKYVKESTGISSAYFQFMRDGVTYTLVDPDLGPLAVGSTEDPLPEFAQYADNEQIPPTVYNSKYGWLCTACMPILDEATGMPVAMFCFDADMNAAMDELWGFMWLVIVLVILMTTIILAVTLYLIRQFATKPLRQLTDATCESYEDVEGQTDMTPIDLDISSNDEIEELYHAIRSMQMRIEDYAQNLAFASAEEERVKTELHMASAIQESMLPSTFPAFPDRPEFSIYATMDAAKDVGGDFFDFFLVDDDRLAMVIADVSGKGVPAALFMMMVKIMISNRAQTGGTPAEILSTVNAQICEHNKTRTFVTVWLGILNTKTGEIICSNAGHEYPWVRGADGLFTVLRDKHSLVLGGSKKTKFTDYTLHVNPGDAIFVHTDGVLEAVNPTHEFFGQERLGATLNGCAGASPEEVLHAVRESVDIFADGADRFDDLTMLCMEFYGASGQIEERAAADGATADVKEITFEAKLENTQQAIDFVAGELGSLACDPKARVQLLAAVDEMVSNVARHAYAPDTGSITVRFASREGGAVAEVTFIDQGVAYNPLEARKPDTTLGAAKREIGGLGIFLVKKTMDEMEYKREDDRNIVHIRKKLED